MGMACLLASLTACQTTTQEGMVNYQGGQVQTQDRAEVARVRTSLGAQYIREGQLDAAQKQLEMAFEADNRYAPAYDMMGILLQQEGSASNLKKADEYFRRAIALKPDFIQARNNYGVYLSQVGRHKEAIAQFEVAASTLGYEGRAGALLNLGLAYLQVKNTTKAKDAFLRSLDVNANGVAPRVELTDVFLNENNLIFAKQTYDAALERLSGQPLPPRVLFQGIRIAILQKSSTQQQSLARQLLALYPLSDEAKKLKAWLVDPTQPLK